MNTEVLTFSVFSIKFYDADIKYWASRESAVKALKQRTDKLKIEQPDILIILDEEDEFRWFFKWELGKTNGTSWKIKEIEVLL